MVGKKRKVTKVVNTKSKKTAKFDENSNEHAASK